LIRSPANDHERGSRPHRAHCVVLLVIGLFTRPAAFILSGIDCGRLLLRACAGGFFPILNAGELAALYSFVFLYLAAAGAGPLSLDRLWTRGKEQ
jgi:putative oxidoreductase